VVTPLWRKKMTEHCRPGARRSGAVVMGAKVTVTDVIVAFR